MSYTLLNKAFHNPKMDADELYRTRFNGKNTIHLDLLVSGYPAFCVLDDSLYVQMLKISKADKKILSLTQALPGRAIQQFTERTLIDEIVLTNGIEGVNSSRKEIGDILRNLEKRNRRNRFYGLVNKYAMLARGIGISLQSPEDIRSLYDDLVLEEVRLDKPDNAPDGKLFRKNQVSVCNAAGQEIHQGVSPEERITEYLAESLRMIDSDEIELPVRVGILHYLLGYIHPFYDGNGRLNRFISSYLLTKEYELLVGFRLSYAITQSLNTYYKGFTTCNDPLNRGDLTPFVIMFLNIVRKAVDEIVQVLTEKNVLYRENLARLHHIPAFAADRDVFDFASVLLQARMFSGDGITTQDLVEVFSVSRPTIAKRLSQIESVGLLERERRGREVHFQINLDELAQKTSDT
jgi:Fic family protein